MKKQDLKEFDVVKTRRGDILIVMKNDFAEEGMSTFSRESFGCQLYFENYRDDLTCYEKSEHDIIAVYRGSSARMYTMLSEFFSESKASYFENKWTWEREEVTELTISEIEQRLGITNLKVIKED